MFILTLFCVCSRGYPAEGELHRLRKASEPVPEKLCVRASCSQSAYLQGRKVPISSLIELSDDAPRLSLTPLCSFSQSCYKYYTSDDINRDSDGMDEQCRYDLRPLLHQCHLQSTRFTMSRPATQHCFNLSSVGGVLKVASSSAATTATMPSARSASSATWAGKSCQSLQTKIQNGTATSAGQSRCKT